MEPDAVSVAAYGAANGSCAAPSPSPYYSSASAPACATFRAPPAPPPSIAQPSGLASAAPSVPLSPTPQGHLGGHLGTFSGHRSNRLLVPITPLNRPYTSGSLEWQFLHAAEVGDKPLMARVLLERERERASALAARAAAAAVSSPEEGGENEREELEPQSSLNINCTDILGRSALVIAVDNENVEMVELLLRQRGLQLGDALLYAIKEGSYRIVEMLLAHPSCTHEMLGSGWGEGGAASDTPDSAAFSRDISPIMLAAVCNQFEIVQLLLSRGARIEKPHPLSCTCQKCALLISHDALRYSKMRINTYRALASPAWISLTTADPILAAFKLCYELNRLASKETEFKEVYKELTNLCKQFACDLLEQCRVEDEVLAILSNEEESLEVWKPYETFSSFVNTSKSFLGQNVNAQGANAAQTLGTDSRHPSLPDAGGVPGGGFRTRASSIASHVLLAPDASQLPAEAAGLSRRPSLVRAGRSGLPVHPSDHEPVVEEEEVEEALPRLRMAIEYGQKQFVAHPHCQQLLMTLWYTNFPNWRKLGTPMKLAISVALVTLMPLLCPLYLLLPKSRVGRFVSSPFVKFMYHATSIALFIVLQFCATLDKGTSGRESNRAPYPNWAECMLVLWALGFCWGETKQVWEEGPFRYLRQWWNWLDIGMLVLNFTTIGIRVWAAVKVATDADGKLIEPRSEWDEYEPAYIAEGVFGISIILSFSRLFFLFSLSQHIGPLQISLGRILVDIAKFVLIFLLVINAFAWGLHEIYVYNHLPGQPPHPAFGQTLVWALFGHVNRYDLRVNTSITSGPQNTLTFTEQTAEIILLAYQATAITVLINILIAMITNSYDRIQHAADREWKFARTKLWLDYLNTGSTLPPPFNIIVSPKSVYYSVLGISRFIRRVLRCICCQKDKDYQDDDVFNGEEVAPGAGVGAGGGSGSRLGLADGAKEGVQPALYKYGQCPSGELSAYFNAKAASEPYQNCSVQPNQNQNQTDGQPYSQGIALKSLNPLGADMGAAPGEQLPAHERSPPVACAVLTQGKGGRPQLCLRCEKRRRYLEITRKLVSRYIHQRKKAYRDEMVNEDDLLEIRQDISSFRFELKEDRRQDLERLSHLIIRCCGIPRDVDATGGVKSAPGNTGMRRGPTRQGTMFTEVSELGEGGEQYEDAEGDANAYENVTVSSGAGMRSKHAQWRSARSQTQSQSRGLTSASEAEAEAATECGSTASGRQLMERFKRELIAEMRTEIAQQFREIAEGWSGSQPQADKRSSCGSITS